MSTAHATPSPDRIRFVAADALQAAELRVRQLLASSDTDALAEWRGIASACRHEVARLTRRRHFTTA